MGTGSTDRRWAIIQHVAYEGPGSIGESLLAAGYGFDIVRPDNGDSLPAAESLGGLVVMGGPMGVHDEVDYPWLVPERELLASAVGLGLPVLGVCLGAQQLAAALGAAVTTGPKAERGVGSVVLTDGGRKDPVFGPEYGGLAETNVPCVHWHQDTFALPEHAVHLAATSMVPHQAFRVGARAYGLQFHVEVTTELVNSWRPHLPEDIALDDRSVSRIEVTGRRLWQRFVTLADKRVLA